MEMNIKKKAGISIVVLLVQTAMFMFVYHCGASSDSTDRIEQLRKDIERLQIKLNAEQKQHDDERVQLNAEHKKAIDRLNCAHAKEIADKATEIERRTNEYKQVLAEKENKIASLNRTVDHYEGLYRTRTVVCIALGTAVVVALFVGTLMGAKGRRDALRECKNHNMPAEGVV